MFQANSTAAITVGNLRISPPIALAPMVGLSHSALRCLVQSMGGVGLLFTEMLAAKRLPHETAEHSALLVKSAAEKPLIYQLICADPQYILPAVEKVHALGAQGIDLNLGCPAPMQKRQGAGSSLVDNLPLLTTMLRSLRRSTNLPLSVKIRLGHRGDNGLADFCRFLEGEGVDLLTVHARYIGEKFCRKPLWNAILPAKQAVNIPVIANGGIFSVEDASICLQESGADGIMIGRGGIEKPWLCAEISEILYGMGGNCLAVDKEKIYYDFIELLNHRFPKEKRLGRLKKFTNYYAKSFQFGHHLGSGVQGCHTIEAAMNKAAEFFQTLRP